MKVITNQSTCIAARQCSQSAPSVFGNSEDGGLVELLNERPAEEDREGAREAENLCPSGSITIDEDD